MMLIWHSWIYVTTRVSPVIKLVLGLNLLSNSITAAQEACSNGCYTIHVMLSVWYMSILHLCENRECDDLGFNHHDDVIMGTMASPITSLTIVYSTIYSGADQNKYQSSASLAFVWGIHQGPVNSTYKWPVTRKMFPFDYVIMNNVSMCTEKVHNLWSS